MLVYWNAGQPGFWDPEFDGAGLDVSTPLGFEPLIASDPVELRREVFRACIPAEPALWLDPDPGMGPVIPNFASAEEAEEARRGLRASPDSVSRVAVVRLTEPDWIVVIFRGTTPSPVRGLLREGQINGMAGQETWSEAPLAMEGARVHRGYAGAYRTVLADVEGAVTAWARTESEKKAGGGGGEGREGNDNDSAGSKPPPKVVVVGHSLGGALATLCSARLAHDLDVLTLAGVQPRTAAPGATGAEAGAGKEGMEVPTAVECVTFGQPRVGDATFRKGMDESSPQLNYMRVVRAGDLFARVPTSGFWLPGGNGGKYDVDYSHAGSLVWTQPDHTAVVTPKGAPPPEGFNSDVRMFNPAGVAMDHAGYAYFFPDELKQAWPRPSDLRTM